MKNRMWAALLLLAPPALAVEDNPAAPVIAAERAFAADAAERGWIAAFKAYAAPDGILFQPDPVNALESLAPVPDTPADTSLVWWPVYAGIAASGDLGFTTGPYTVGGDQGFGHYFTVWAKQSDGTWKWIFDGGPRNAEASPLKADTDPVTLPVATALAPGAETAMAEVQALEAVLAADSLVDAPASYQKILAEGARVQGSPAQPATTADAVAAEIQGRGKVVTFKPLGGRSSSAGDLVFTYGSAVFSPRGEPREGHYVRIWQRQGEGYKIVFDQLLIKPPPRPQN